MIFVPWHFPLHEDSSIQGASEKAEKEFKKAYPIIYNHLLKYKDELLKRNQEETGIRYEWYAMQRCAATYYPEFEKEKVVWNRIVSKKEFSFVDKDILIQDSMHFIVGKNLFFFVSILNSRLFNWLLNIIIGTAVGGNAANADNVKNLFIPELKENEQKTFIDLANKIISLKKQNPNADTTELENQIDKLVYQLYNLTTDEIKIIEGEK